MAETGALRVSGSGMSSSPDKESAACINDGTRLPSAAVRLWYHSQNECMLVQGRSWPLARNAF